MTEGITRSAWRWAEAVVGGLGLTTRSIPVDTLPLFAICGRMLPSVCVAPQVRRVDYLGGPWWVSEDEGLAAVPPRDEVADRFRQWSGQDRVHSLVHPR